MCAFPVWVPLRTGYSRDSIMVKRHDRLSLTPETHCLGWATWFFCINLAGSLVLRGEEHLAESAPT